MVQHYLYMVKIGNIVILFCHGLYQVSLSSRAAYSNSLNSNLNSISKKCRLIFKPIPKLLSLDSNSASKLLRYLNLNSIKIACEFSALFNYDEKIGGGGGFMRSNTVNGIFFIVLYFVLFPVNKYVCMYVCMYEELRHDS